MCAEHDLPDVQELLLHQPYRLQSKLEKEAPGCDKQVRYRDSTEIDDDGRPLDPTDDMMLIFANDNNITTEEAWHRFRGEQFICKVALVILSFGHTPQSFKEEYGNFEYSTNLTDAQLEELKAKKASAMTELVQKCIHAIYGCRTYSYFRTDVTSPYHKVIDPLDIMYSRMKSKWEKSILLIIDQT